MNVVQLLLKSIRVKCVEKIHGKLFIAEWNYIFTGTPVCDRFHKFHKFVLNMLIVLSLAKLFCYHEIGIFFLIQHGLYVIFAML